MEERYRVVEAYWSRSPHDVFYIEDTDAKAKRAECYSREDAELICAAFAAADAASRK